MGYISRMDEENDEIAKLSARRRAVFERVRARFASAGTPIDSDPRFLDLVEEWVNGNVEIAEVTRGYDNLKRSRQGAAMQLPPAPQLELATEQEDDLFRELELAIGMDEPPQA